MQKAASRVKEVQLLGISLQEIRTQLTESLAGDLHHPFSTAFS